MFGVILTQRARAAGQAPRAAGTDTPEPSEAGESTGRKWTEIEIVLSVSLLVFALLIFMLQTVIIMKLNVDWTPISILRFNGLTLIITGGLLLVIAGYSNEQMSPVIGLLGAIAGYLLGSAERPEKTTEPPTK